MKGKLSTTKGTERGTKMTATSLIKKALRSHSVQGESALSTDAEPETKGERRKKEGQQHTDIMHPCGPNCIRHRLVSLRELSLHTRLPLKWLRRVVRFGQLPYLRAGNRVLFSVEHAEREILSLARKSRFGQCR